MKNTQNTTPEESNMKSLNSGIKSFSHEQLRDALMFAQDCLDRADMPYFVWDKTAEHIMNNEEEFTGDSEITLAIKQSEVTKEHVSILEHWTNSRDTNMKKTDDTIEIDYRGIPIVIHIIKGSYRFLDHPDTKYFFIENFRVPNPFSDYWNQRKTII